MNRGGELWRLGGAITGVRGVRVGVGFAAGGVGISLRWGGGGLRAAGAWSGADCGRRLRYGVGSPFTAGQIVLWYGLNFVAGPKSFPADVGTLGAVDKIAQVSLIVVLAVLLSQD